MVSNFFGLAPFFAKGLGPGGATGFADGAVLAGGRDTATGAGPSVTSDTLAAAGGAAACTPDAVALVRMAARSCASSSPVW